jgi:hypothetical protein
MEFQDEFGRQQIRYTHPFTLFSIEADKNWISLAQGRLPKKLKDIITFSYSEVFMETFKDRFCHYYKKLPNIMPDFIYVDGPAGAQVHGMIDGSDFKENIERTVISGDLLRIEPTLLPETMIVFDGRTNNARFVKNNFQRLSDVTESEDGEYTLFQLIEPPLGMHNKKRSTFHNIPITRVTK